MDLSDLTKESLALVEKYVKFLKKIQSLHGTTAHTIATTLKGNFTVIDSFDEYHDEIIRIAWSGPTSIPDVERLLLPYSSEIDIKKRVSHQNTKYIDIHPRGTEFGIIMKELLRDLLSMKESMSGIII